jgi:hypothetical protein
MLVAAGVLAVAGPAAAQGASAWDKGWIDVNFGVAKAAEDSYTSVNVTTISGEAGAGAVAYGLPKGGSFDVGGGYMFHPRVGIGVSLAGTAHEDIAGLAISVPHPLYFNASAEAATVTDAGLTRAEGAWHIHAMVVALQTPRVRVRVFGGPSYIRAEQDAVSLINYHQSYSVFSPANSVAITSYRSNAVDGGGWGFHGGADLAVFFNRIVGVGTMVRVSRATVDLDDYGGVESRKVGGVQFGGGLRLKF